MKRQSRKLILVLVAMAAVVGTSVYAQLPAPTDDAKDAFIPQKHYSP